MKLTAPVDDVEVFGRNRNTAPREFTHKVSPKQIDILVNRIYSRKIEAVVRELCCNAYDAHKLLGKEDVPFQLSVPSTLDPRFIVRDFGPGVSEQEVEEVLTTFFASTKDDSDEFVGGLGLGFKVPFAKVDTFSMNSYQNGGMTSYTMYRENGKLLWRPETIEPLPTDEPDGLEVIVPVSDADMAEYSRMVSKVLYWFKVRPELSDEQDRFKKFDDIVVFDHEDEYGRIRVYDWSKLHDNHRYHYNGEHFPVSPGGPVLTMGQVAYPIEGEFRIDTGHYTSLVVDVPIGAVDIQPGRESLSYDDRTRDFIKERLASAKKCMSDQFNERLNKATNVREAQILAYDGYRPAGTPLEYCGTMISHGHVRHNFFMPERTVAVHAEEIATEGLLNAGIVGMVVQQRDGISHYYQEQIAVAVEEIMSDPVKLAKAHEWAAEKFGKEGEEFRPNVRPSQNPGDIGSHGDALSQLKAWDRFIPIYVLVDDAVAVPKKLTKIRNKVKKEYATSDRRVAIIIVTGPISAEWQEWNNNRHYGRNNMVFCNVTNQYILKKSDEDEDEAPQFEDVAWKGYLPITDAQVEQVTGILAEDDIIYKLSDTTSKEDRTGRTYKLMSENSIGRTQWQLVERPARGIYWPIVNQTLLGFANKRVGDTVDRVAYDASACFQRIRKFFEKRTKRKVYLMPVDTIESLEDDGNWVSIFQLMQEFVDEMRADRPKMKGVAMTKRAYSDYQEPVKFVKKIQSQLAKGHELRKLGKMVEEFEKAYAISQSDEVQVMVSILWMMGDERFYGTARGERGRYKQPKSAVVDPRVETLLERYRLLFANHYLNSKKDLTELAFYANAKAEAIAA